MAVGSTLGGTMLGAKDDSAGPVKARLIPRTIATPNRSAIVIDWPAGIHAVQREGVVLADLSQSWLAGRAVRSGQPEIRGGSPRQLRAFHGQGLDLVQRLGGRRVFDARLQA